MNAEQSDGKDDIKIEFMAEGPADIEKRLSGVGKQQK